MNRKVLFCGLLGIILLSMMTGCAFENDNSVTEAKNSSDNKEMVNMIKAIINEKEYMVNLENSSTTEKLIDHLPLQFNMNDLNNNEKYSYLDYKLPTDEYKPKQINKGDIMLFGDDCLVIFYKSFNTSYSYTKIGHIDNLPDLGDGNIVLKLEK